MGEGEIRLCLLPACSKSCLLTRYGREIESSRKTEAGRKETEREGVKGESENRRHTGTRKRGKALGSTTTGNLTPVTTLAVVNTALIHFLEKEPWRLHTYTHSHIFTNTVTNTHHTNH